MLSKAFITDLVALFPGRLARAFEISIVSTLAVIVSMTFEIPSPDVSAYVIFGLLRAKESGFVVRDDALARGLDYLAGALVATKDLNSVPDANRQAWLLDVLGEGRLVNLAAAHGHPASVMDMSFAAQALSTEWALEQKGNLQHQVYDVPKAVDEWVATLKLQTMGITIDTLTDEQRKYLASWEMGT